MEEEQGVKFIMVANSRGLEISDSIVADLDAPPIDLSFLDRMDLDLRRSMMPGFVP